MTATVNELLIDAIADQLSDLMAGAEPGHCVRVDDVDSALSRPLAAALSERIPQTAIHILRSRPEHPEEIRPERAIEIRNRKAAPALLLVPAGEGHAASSLDNSFRRVPILDVFFRTDFQVELATADGRVQDAVRRLRRHFAKGNAEAWAEFLASLAADPTEAGFGRNLWRIGLVPDLGPDPMSRVERNRVTTRAISRPIRPAATIDDRMTAASLRAGVWRGPLRNFLEHHGARLANPRLWTREISDQNAQFSFHLWEFADVVREDLESLSVKPFADENGNILKSSKLKRGADGQALLEVSEEVPSPIVIEWTTEPAKVAAVAKWRLDVLRPVDQRTDDDEALASATVAGRNRRGTIKITASEDDLAAGTHFVVVVTAVGEHGGEIDLTSGMPASAESQEFQILVGEPPETKTRRSAAPSVPEAIVRAALEGADDLTEDQVSWDLDSQVFGFRLGNRRSAQVRVNDIIVRLQRLATGDPRFPAHYVAQGKYGSVLQIEPERTQELILPQALLKARAEFLTLLADSGARNTVESAEWTPALRDAARAFAASYRRALDGAADDGLTNLLLMDTASIDVRRNDEVVRAVVVLPIHPLRASWAVSYDEVMRDWAAQLKELPKNARASSLSRDLISQVAPANLPFAVRHISGETAVYAEELTFAAGLNVVPGRLDRDTAAEAISTVLGTERRGSTMRASSRLVEERISAYERSHNPGNALRLLAINPGSGELLAGALPAVRESDPDDGDDRTEQRRIEVIAYAEDTAYVRPVPAIADLQNEFRKQKSSHGLTHLAPMFSFAVRSTSALLGTSESAHLAVLQDPGAVSIGLSSATERKPSFRDLLVPLVTSRSAIDNTLVWSAVPATGPQSGGGDAELSVIHRSHQRAMARALGAPPETVPAVQVRIGADTRDQIRAAHAQADWVIGTDKFVGVNLFETGLEEPYVLDYAPDFVEGIGDRLTVTTTHRDEIEHLLDMAMSELGLEAVGGLTSVLADLSVVSGRLALRLLENNTQAREAVSLAALVSHLRKRGELEDIIVVPVDAHPEIFGVAARDEGSARRCDLLLVKLGQRSFKIECVEVKSRKEAHLAQALADQILEQLEETKRVLEFRYFADEPRVDAEVQTARLASLLHYYADRSYAHALIADERLSDIHRYIDRIGQSGERAEITMKGYVVSLDGDQGFKKKYGDVPMQVLTAGDLGQIGFTTLSAREAAAAASMEEDPDPAQSDADVSASSETAGPAVSDTSLPQVPSQSADAFRPLDNTSAEQPHSVAVDASPTPVPEARSTAEVAVTLGQDAGGSPVTWRVSTKGSPHAFVIGIPGQGKSVTTRKIIRDFAAGGLPSLVFDFHGDMAADPPAGATVLDAAAGLPFSPFDPGTTTPRPINSTAWEIAEVLAYVAGLGEIQRTHVYQALQQVYATHGWSGTQSGTSLPTLAEFSEVLGEVESGSAGKNARGRLLPFTDFGLFSDRAESGFQILADPPHGWVIDVSQLMEEVQRVAASFILRRVYREMFSWGQNHTMKLAVILDEAHRMAKDVTLPKIMKEGRKYGVGVLVASQSADDFHSDVLGNAGTKIVFRTNFPASKAVSNMLRGRNGVDLSQEIEKLGVGVAYVSTPDAVQARKVYMEQ